MSKYVQEQHDARLANGVPSFTLTALSRRLKQDSKIDCMLTRIAILIRKASFLRFFVH